VRNAALARSQRLDFGNRVSVAAHNDRNSFILDLAQHFGKVGLGFVDADGFHDLLVKIVVAAGMKLSSGMDGGGALALRGGRFFCNGGRAGRSSRPALSRDRLGGEGEAFGAEEAGFFEEVIVATGVGGHLAGVDVEDSVGELSDEVHIVGDEDEGAFVGFEREDERFDGEDVEVGGRLVHQENIRGIDEELDEVEAGFFATAENGRFFEDVVSLEKEGAKDAAGLVFAEGDP